MKVTKAVALVLSCTLLLCACGAQGKQQYDAIEIHLGDDTITVDGKLSSTNTADAIYVANDIVYYESGKDFTYGEGTENDAHSKEEAQSHTVIHIAKAGVYAISGKLSRGQVAIDLGEDAEEDPNAVVTLILNGVDLTCEVAPAVIFYNVYECGNTDADTATKDVDTSAAGANVIIADGTENSINGSYVERIYKPDSVELNEDGTAVEDAEKLHKYDGAFYSKMSMNIDGGDEGTGVLNINASNEGLDSELHLTINGGNINILSGNDGINTNEDGVSVTTVNGGALTIAVTGETGEGDGIDSNGWLVINGGSVVAAACSDSADAGIDSDMGIHINGGTVIATGSMLDRIEDGGQNYAVFNFAQKQTSDENVTLKNGDKIAVMTYDGKNAYSVLIYSAPDLTAGVYTLWSGNNQLAGQSGGTVGAPDKPNVKPEGGTLPEMPDGEAPSSRPEPPTGAQPPEGTVPPTGEQPQQGVQPPPKLDGQDGSTQRPDGNNAESSRTTTDFKIVDGANMFTVVINQD